jgi:CHAT domain-containing protein
MIDHPRCLDSEELAAFIAGTLTGDELLFATRHLVICRECREDVGAVAQCVREGIATTRPRAERTSPRWLAMAAAALIGVFSVGVWQRSRVQDPIQQLAAAAPDHRYLEPRLSGFRWTPLQPVRRSSPEPLDAQQLRFVGAAGAVLEQTAGNPSVRARHAAGLANLIAGRPTEAAAILRGIDSTDPRIWSNRAAALYTAAADMNEPSKLAEALAATDSALRLDPKLPEALFNRALILERLGLRDNARDAWQHYLAVAGTSNWIGVDDTSEWASEARQHLQRLSQSTMFRDVPRQHDALARELAVVRSTNDHVLHEAACQAALNRAWSDSISFLDRELELLHGDDRASAEVLLMRARIKARTGAPGAAADLMRAAQAIKHLPDNAVRRHAEADRLAVQGALVAGSPSAAIPLLTRAIESHASQGGCVYLPEMYLQRGRAFTALGRLENAAVDFEAGLREIEQEHPMTSTRSSVKAHDDRWETVVAREELFDEALSVALSRGETMRAFTYAERARTEAEPKAARATVAPDNVIIEYAALPRRLVIFVINDGKLHIVQSNVRRDTLAYESNLVATSAMARDNAQFRRSATVLYNHLIAPVADAIAASSTLVFVPDRTLSNVPFSALLGPDHRYVIQQHTVLVAPSMATYARQTTARLNPRKVLVITGPSLQDGDFARLTSTYREAAAVAAVYGGADRTAGADFLRRATTARFIHFAGHGIAAQGNTEAALLTARANGETSLLTAHDIAASDLSHVQLVVLSACETAREEDTGQRESLARAFLAAGAANVVGTLWRIEDADAAEFFPRLHQHLAEGRTPADALRATQLDWLRRPNGPLGMWAAVQVIGTEPPTPSRKQKPSDLTSTARLRTTHNRIAFATGFRPTFRELSANAGQSGPTQPEQR